MRRRRGGERVEEVIPCVLGIAVYDFWGAEEVRLGGVHPQAADQGTGFQVAGGVEVGEAELDKLDDMHGVGLSH
jgi:hypothetical protein